MNDRIQVSAWGIRHNTGPIHLTLRQADGELVDTQVTEGETNVRLVDVPAHIASEFEVKGIELQDFNIVKLSVQEQEALRANIEREGVTLGCLCIENRCIGEAEDVYRKADVAYIAETIALGGRLGAKTVRVNIHQPPVFPQLGHAPLDVIIDELRYLVRVAAENGTQLVLENHDEVTNSPDAMRRIFEEVGPELGFILDTTNVQPFMDEVIHSFMNHVPPRYISDAEPAFDYIKEMLPYATVVHMKTFGFEEDGQPILYDQQRAVDMVAESGFAGPITVECASANPALVYPAIRQTINMLRASNR